MACCGPYLSGEQAPPSAEALMRSRYSAYALGLGDYLHASWSTTTRPSRIDIDPRVRWLGLKVLRCTQGPGDDNGTVEFVARSKLDGRAQRLHEISRFIREQGRWLYLDGQLLEQHRWSKKKPRA